MKTFPFFLLIVLSCLFLGSCKSDNNTTAVSNHADAVKIQSLDDLRSAYKSQANGTTGNALISGLLKTLNSVTDGNKRSTLLTEGYNIATEQNITSRAAGFLFPLIKESNSPASADQLYDLGILLKKINKESASNTLFQGIVDKFSNYSKLDEVKSMITVPMTSIDD